MTVPTTSTDPLRIGVLGAARITELALLSPARALGVEVVACAARDPRRAREFADRHGIPRVHTSYAELLADPDVEAVYDPLPNGLHGHWNRRAAEAGKHVLAEKPSAANADEARATLEAVRASGVVLMEAFHYPYHPLWQRAVGIVRDGGVGEVRHVEATLSMPDPGADDPRWNPALAGGSTMDLGCYSLSALRLLGALLGGPPRLTGASARAREGAPGVDAELWVDVEYPSGVTGRGGSRMDAAELDFHLTVQGTAGTLHVPSYPLPHLDDSLVLRAADGTETVEHLGERSSYTYQLEVFRAAVREDAPVLTDAQDAVEQMELVDAAYRLAGMEPHHPTPHGERV
ncbi:Gfo/Idh/MocA family oxidoreductase [Phycicoccus sp. CSK15P-2]|uniref:Gfo/Idh/MocA family protein n=1 Tax=Phycicoccus sp. CSK15P-2 TaxID=2807627 RepID=UPI00194DF47B|nr:Gfo/Idh/MocA family oxidoreductase [Phycicoccus sp. CSK15P-2]MBM6406033.1 Gfo/Idh/MocA family oxidoreductase [Phycicoccus sp. CSK15P-2]